ncbi:MAG TPA: MFS transporter [Chloroflexota bacterium]|nr:MFS transporter [Chloroflexota bacterium]
MAGLRGFALKAGQSFRNYNFRLFWTGQLISQCGTWMQSVAQAWLVLEIAHSPVALGTVTALQFLPITLGSMMASVLVDRIPKRRLLAITQTAALIQASLMAALYASGHIQLWHIYLLALFLGCTNALDAPTRQSFVMELVGRESLVNAVGLNSAIQSGSRLVGPAIGGLVIATLGLTVCFAANAVSFLAVLLCLALMRPADFYAVAERAPRQPGNYWRELLAGARFVFRDPELAGLVLVLTTLGVFGFNYATMIPLFATQGLGLGPEGFGLLQAAVGVGALVAAISLAGSERPATWRILAAGACFGILQLSSSQARWFPLAMLLVAGFACCGTFFSMSSNSTLQLRSPDNLRGRVMGLYTTLVMGATPLGALLTGLLAKAAGIRWTMFTWGSLCLTASLLGLAYTATLARRTSVEYSVQPR